MASRSGNTLLVMLSTSSGWLLWSPMVWVYVQAKIHCVFCYCTEIWAGTLCSMVDKKLSWMVNIMPPFRFGVISSWAIRPLGLAAKSNTFSGRELRVWGQKGWIFLHLYLTKAYTFDILAYNMYTYTHFLKFVLQKKKKKISKGELSKYSASHPYTK